MNNWPEDFKTFLVGMLVYLTISVLLSLLSNLLSTPYQLNYLESFGLVMIYVAVQSGYTIWNNHE